MKLSQTTQFKKDIKRQVRQGKDQKKLIAVVNILLDGCPLPPKNMAPPLKGAWKGRRDCHIEPDWILIYRVSDDELRLERTGTHSDLF
jgi:mRNA interferase YafQ